MQLPNKLYSYKNSTLALVPVVLKELKEGRLPVKDLYNKVKPVLNDPTDFIAVMDCLYALRAADIDDNGEVYICLQK